MNSYISCSHFVQKLEAGFFSHIYLQADPSLDKICNLSGFSKTTQETYRTSIFADTIPAITGACLRHQTTLSFVKKNEWLRLSHYFGLMVVYGILGCLFMALGVLSALLLGVFLESNLDNSTDLYSISCRAHKEHPSISVQAAEVTLDEVILDPQVEEEIFELVSFLKDPAPFIKMGVHPPRGFLLVGPPGVGKTLVAKTLARQLSVDFFAYKGSDFIRKYVGESALLVREMFKEARKHTPCIIYIDEIDAFSRNRDFYSDSKAVYASQALTQFLNELDGFQTTDQVIVIGSTNRKNILDPALLRPGRLSKIVELHLPNQAQRAEILKLWVKKKKIPLQDPLLCDEFAVLTYKFSGADLRNLLNEAAVYAAKEGSAQVCALHLHQALERIVFGSRQKSSESKSAKLAVAYHEAGHMISFWKEHQERMKVLSRKDQSHWSKHTFYATILPGDKFAGLVSGIAYDDIGQFPDASYLKGRMRTCLASRAAERIYFEKIKKTPQDFFNLGFSGDLSQAKWAATQYILLGFSQNPLFLANCGEISAVSKLSESIEAFNEAVLRLLLKNYSTSLQDAFLKETDCLLESASQDVSALLEKNCGVLEKLAELLYAKETLSHEEIVEFFKQNPLH